MKTMETRSSNIRDVEDWIETLSPREHMIFDKGFATALKAVMEDFTEAKLRIFNKVAEIAEDQDEEAVNYQKQLLARVSVLDLYEKLYKKRIATIEPSVAALNDHSLES